VSLIQIILKDASSVSFVFFNLPQSFAHIPVHVEELLENESALSLSEFIMKCKTQIMCSEMKAYMLSSVCV